MATTAEALHPQTQANLHVAILAIAKIHGLGDVPDSVIGYLMDEMRDNLNPQQRMDPLSVYSPQILGMVDARIKETYGIDRPANIHGAPQGPQGKDASVPAEAGSVFAWDGLGRNRFEQLTGGTSGSYARAVSELGTSSAAYGTLTRAWDPASGVAGLNEFNFGGTPFARSGLDLATTKYLFGQGFSTPQIVNAAADLKALGLNPKDPKLVEGAATQERFDPQGRGQRQHADAAYAAWAEKNAEEINRRLAVIESLSPGTPQHQAAVAELRQLMEQGYEDTGQAAVDERLRTVEPAAGAKEGDRVRAIEHQKEKRDAVLDEQGANVESINKLGFSSSRALSKDEILESYVPTTSESAADEQATDAAATDNFFSAVSEGAASPESETQGEAVAGQDAKQQVATADDSSSEEPTKPVQVAKGPPMPGPGGIGHA